MFRYIAFSWNAADEAQANAAKRLQQALDNDKRWNSAFQASGVCVYISGSRRGVNDAYRLPANQGVILGRLFRRSDAPPDPQSDITLTEREAQQIVHSDGRSLIDQFWGRYIAFLPSWTGEARVLRDPTGTLPCFRLEIQGMSVVMSRLEDLLSLVDVPMPRVDLNAVRAHMVLGLVSGQATLLEGVTQILAGELTPLAAASGSPLRLWSAVDHAQRASTTGPDESADLLRDTVISCVRSWASCYSSVVLRLSGGVDSAILLACLTGDATTAGPVCLNYYSAGTDTDERTYARLAARQCGATLVERTVNDGFRLEDVLDVARTPLPANYVGSMATMRTDAEVVALHHAGAVFNGAGGDQLFFQVRRTWPAADYLKLHGMGRGFLQATLDASRLGNVSFWQALRQALIDRNFRGDPLAGAGHFLTLMPSDAIEEALANAHRFVHPGWLEAQDLPIGKFNQLGMVINPFEYYNHYLREAAAERVQPLMSQPLLELCLQTPTFMLTRGGRGRGLARTAFADRIPPEIANRSSKGGMEDYMTAVLQRHIGFAREMLLEGHLAKNGLLDRARVEAALAGRPTAKPTYLTEIHACIATEAWLQRTAASTGTVPH